MVRRVAVLDSSVKVPKYEVEGVGGEGVDNVLKGLPVLIPVLFVILCVRWGVSTDKEGGSLCTAYSNYNNTVRYLMNIVYERYKAWSYNDSYSRSLMLGVATKINLIEIRIELVGVCNTTLRQEEKTNAAFGYDTLSVEEFICLPTPTLRVNVSYSNVARIWQGGAQSVRCAGGQRR